MDLSMTFGNFNNIRTEHMVGKLAVPTPIAEAPARYISSALLHRIHLPFHSWKALFGRLGTSGVGLLERPLFQTFHLSIG